jgi:hypothetical protein
MHLASCQEQDAAIQDIMNSVSTLRLEWVSISRTDVHSTTRAVRNNPFQLPGLTTSTAVATQRLTLMSSWCPRGLCGWEWGKMPSVDTRMYTLPTFQGKAHVRNPLWSFKLPQHFLLSAYPPGQVVACASVSWYCFMFIDRYTHWSETLHVSEITAEAVTKAFNTFGVACFG